MYKIKEDENSSNRKFSNELILCNKFKGYKPHSETEILILGTFHPEVRRTGNFFYCAPGNYLWKILPVSFNEKDLCNQPLSKKKEFMRDFRIDFTDIIDSIKTIPQESLFNFGDEHIDSFVDQWSPIESTIANLKHLKAAYFTRKTLGTIPNIEKKIAQIRNHCVQKSIRFSLLETPERHFAKSKILSWKMTIIDKSVCR
jgi:hypothetical protein